MAAAAPLMASKFLIPAIGAVAGAGISKKQGGNPLQGALMGGLGGAALGPAMGGIGSMLGAKGATAAASPAIAALGVGPEAMAAQGVAMEAMAGGVSPGIAAQMAGMSPQATSALASPMTSGLIGSPPGPSGMAGLLSNVSRKDAVMTGGKMALGGMQPNQPMPQPMAMPVQQRQQTRSMMSLGQQSPGLGRSINFMKGY